MGKTKNKITNWSHYNQALIQRGSITFWIDDSAIDGWYCSKHHGKRGRGFEFSDVAIETALMVKGVFSMPLRALQGFIYSIVTIMDVPLRSPNYSSISKRAKNVKVTYCQPSKSAIRHIAIDSTGSKVFGVAFVGMLKLLISLSYPQRRLDENKLSTCRFKNH